MKLTNFGRTSWIKPALFLILLLSSLHSVFAAEYRAPWANVICYNGINRSWDFLPDNLEMGSGYGHAILENGSWKYDSQNTEKSPDYILENRGWPRMTCSKLRKLCTDHFGRASKRVYASQRSSIKSQWGRFFEKLATGELLECSPQPMVNVQQ